MKRFIFAVFSFGGAVRYVVAPGSLRVLPRLPRGHRLGRIWRN